MTIAITDIPQGTVVTWAALLQNNGTADGPDGTVSPAPDGHALYRAAFYVDGQLVNWADNWNGPLLAGTSHAYPATGGPNGTATYAASAVGAHTLTCTVDAPGFISESDKTNNSVTVPFNIVAAGGGGGGGGTGSRAVYSQAGSAASPWNQPRGVSCAFSSNVMSTGGNANANNGFGLSVGWAAGIPTPPAYPLVDQINTNQFAESHYSFIQSDLGHAIEWYEYQNVNDPNRNSYLTDLHGDLLNTGAHQLTGPAGLGYSHVAKNSGLSGIVRYYDIYVNQKIEHVLAWCLPNSGLHTGYVWPAFGQDGDAASAYTGLNPIGTFCAIPTGTAKPGLTVVGGMVWDSFLNFGAYICDRGATAPLLFEAKLANEAAALQASGDLGRIFSQVRRVTNSATGPSTGVIGGPGARMVAAPPLPA